MSPNDDARNDRELDRLARKDDRIAREASAEAQRAREVQYARPERATDPMIDRADEIRAESDARTDERQAQLAEDQRRAAEDLQSSSGSFSDATGGLDRTRARVVEGKQEAERLVDSARDLREQTRRLLEDVRASKPRIAQTGESVPPSGAEDGTAGG